MNITERIEQVLDQRGINKSELARRMNKHNQQVNRLIDNPKWETIEAVANAIGIAPCELFTQEIEAAGYRLAPEQQPSAQGGQEKEAQGDGLPFSSGQPIPADAPTRSLSDIAHQSSGQPSVQIQQAIICPHCKKAMTITVQA